MKQLKSLCRLFSTVLVILGTSLTVCANEIVDTEESSEEIVAIELESTTDSTENVIVVFFFPIKKKHHPYNNFF